MKKLTKKELTQLEILILQRGPMTFKGLKENHPKADETTMMKLVDKGLARIRKTPGRTDRIEALAEGKRQFNEQQ